ncbi:histidine phosphatase family protein [Streptomyces sp. SID5785]|uniref:histidine phosphatase family protein n=1 Tax=Streptomyces sp. SID5785 TaxID=2690309 RepID=UPI00136130B1|nr:histidine phosphatase family protein [Streptomyces sp. SID5785]MZD04303.1 histidine phosphatase family protein [Streptomyces sp. SID5785]
MRLLLIRHGQTSSNLKHLLDTAEPGPGLTPLGIRQADALPEALAGERIDALYASTLLRTRLTATPLARARGLDILVRPGIREIEAGELEMRGDEEAVTTYLTTALAWAGGDLARRMPGGETGAAALARFDGVVAEAAESGAEAVAMVSHGAAIRTWAAARAALTDPRTARQALDNTGLVVLSGSPADGWRLERWESRPAGPRDPAPHHEGPAGEPIAGA